MLRWRTAIRRSATGLFCLVASFLPAAGHAGELHLVKQSTSLAELDGSALDLDGVADGTVTLDRLELDDGAEIVVSASKVVFAVRGDVVLNGGSIRPADALQGQGPTIEIRARNITLVAGANVRADGQSAGGSLHLCARRDILIESSARVSASALDNSGSGGSIVLTAGQRIAVQKGSVVRADGGQGGKIELLSCATDYSRRGQPLILPSIALQGRLEALGSSGPGGTVSVTARKGGIDFRPVVARRGFPTTLAAQGSGGDGTIVLTAATVVIPAAPPAMPAAVVRTQSPSTESCSCNGGGGDATAPTVIAIDQDRTGGVPGTVFNLTGRVVPPTARVDHWRWSLTDGRAFDGPTISVTFSSPGLYGVTLTALDSQNRAVQSDSGVQIVDPASQAPPELHLPDLLGDVDGDGQITLKDAYLVAKHASRLQSLPAGSVSTADVDLDSQVTPTDASLLGQAVAAGKQLPVSLSPAHGAPGARVNLISPELLDPAAKIEIEVGESAWVQQPLRPVRGFATFLIPLDVSQRGTVQVTPGSVSIRIRSDGVVVQTLRFDVEPPVPLPADPKAELSALLDDYSNLIDLNQVAMQQLLEVSNVSADARQVLLATFTLAKQDVSREVAKLRAVLSRPGADEFAQLFFRFADANGYPALKTKLNIALALKGPELRARLQSLRTAHAPASIEEILAVLCALKEVAETLETAGDVLSVWCDIVFVLDAAVAVGQPEIGIPLLLEWIGSCGEAEAFLEVPLLLDSFFAKMDADLRFTADPERPQAGEAVSLQAKVELIGADDLCSFAVGHTADDVIKALSKIAIQNYIKKKLALREMAKAIRALSPALLDELEKRLSDAVSIAIGHTQLGTYLTEFANKACDSFQGGAPIVDDLQKIGTGPVPNVGTLTFVGDGTASYLCPVASIPTVDSVVFTATRAICEQSMTKTVTVHCASHGVTITMGDNGNLNDDIFEIQVDGSTVLTSSEPVRSISTTVDLSVGDHTVLMIGRAAPDGVGTYFIEFSGATVVGGDPLSGTDLTPGVVKTFLIRVQ